MLVALITFLAAFVGLVILFGYQSRQLKLRQAIAKNDGTQNESPFEYIDHRAIEAHVGSFVKHMSRAFVLWVLKVSIKASFSIRRKIDMLVTKARKIAERHQKELKEREESAGARFLKTIGDYKTKIEKLRRKDKTFDNM